MNDISLTRQDTQVMKGIAISAMLFHHLYGDPPVGVEPYSGLLMWLGILGKVCVALFLFCSGYGLSSNYTQQSISDDVKFVVKRLVKFYYNYWMIFLIFVPISIFVFHRSLTDAYGDNANIFMSLFRDILGWQGFESYNVTWWFNKLLIILYLLFPFIYRMVKLMPIITIITGIMVVRLEHHFPVNTIDIYVWQLPFILGIVYKLYEEEFSKMYSRLSDSKIISGIASLTLLSITIILRIWPIIPHWAGVRMDGFISYATAIVIVSVIRYMPYIKTLFSFVGKHAINIYMTHTFFNMYWFSGWLHGSEYMREGLNFIVLMIICIAVSTIIEYMKERLGLNIQITKLQGLLK